MFKYNYRKNSGFTLIEVISALTILCMIFAAAVNMNFLSLYTHKSVSYRDLEYNLARSICEGFRSESVIVPNRTVVLYLDRYEDIIGSISDIMINGYDISSVSYNDIKINNSGNKKFAAVINSYRAENLSVLKVSVVSMANEDNGIALRITR